MSDSRWVDRYEDEIVIRHTSVFYDWCHCDLRSRLIFSNQALYLNVKKSLVLTGGGDGISLNSMIRATVKCAMQAERLESPFASIMLGT
jgi:hypothetical protein